METLSDKVRGSAERISAQSAQFIEATRGAGGEFVTRAKSAGDAFWGETRSASGALVAHTVGAQRELVGLVQSEAEAWLDYVREETARLSRSALPRGAGTKAPGGAPRAPKAAPELKLPTPRELELELLSRLDAGLKTLEARVQQRLEARTEPQLPSGEGAATAVTSVTSVPAAKPAKVAARALPPLPDYDQLTAK